MHNRLLKHLSIPLCMALFFLSCEKAADAPVDTAKGKIVMTVTAKHHSWGVPGLPVYLKYNATEFPGTNTALYNMSGITDQNGAVQFTQLSLGNYYLYARGWDALFGDTVYGYMPVVVNTSTAGGNLVDVTMYVTE
jgi:hypothetical protein